MKHALFIAGVLLNLLLATSATAQSLLLQQPSISQDVLAFVYAGDIWVAARDGANPRRLTSAAAEENEPRVSPDGSMIAFAAAYENNIDVYVISTSGGQPRRLTWHPGRDTPLGWTANGTQVVLTSARERDHGRSSQLYHVGLTGGLPAKQMQARIFRGQYDAAGMRLAYFSHRPGYNGLFGGSAGWKGYRGGSTPAIRILDLAKNTVVTIPGAGATNINPIWLNEQLYFLSDRENKTFNLFKYDAANGSIDKVSNETTWDIRSAAGHGSSIVYSAGGRLQQLDLTRDETSEIVIDIKPDLPQLRPQWKDAGKTLQYVHISPSGKRAIVTARGEVFTIPIDQGSTRNITNTGGLREYSALWSPAGQEVAYIAQTSAGQELVIKDQTGMGDSRRFDLGDNFYRLLDWTRGETGQIVYQDNHLGLHAIDLSNGRSTHIATGARRDSVETASSSDGRWLAYTREQPNFHRDLFLFDFDSKVSTLVTDGNADIAAPAFSPDGQYLYFAASTNTGPIQVGLNMTSQEKPYRAGLYALVLATDSPSPLLPERGDEEKEGAEEDSDDDDAAEDETPVTRIDLTGLASRMVALPVAEQNYGNLEVAADGSLFYVRSVQPGASNEPPGSESGPENTLMRFDFEEKEATEAVAEVSGFAISANGEYLILRKDDDSLYTVEVGDDMDPEKLDLSGLRLLVNPTQEWAQIFDEAWRMEKEFFYAANMHGLDWQSIYDQYQPLLAHVGRREDLNALIIEMIAEMQVGHNRISGGDLHRESPVQTGLLGANFEIEKNRYRIAKIYTGESWNPFFAAPLATPGNAAREGEYILAVNGTPLTSEDNIFNLLQGTVGEQVTLRVGPSANGRNARDIDVEPVASERGLRLWAWIEHNRRAVAEATDGRV
ncbi:MAG: PDZ domain-containing protein, partial [Gammaproteobacteria bacterium]|nr:PDZ domain-containing protein [Gammaproteobacteria bacterium]